MSTAILSKPGAKCQLDAQYVQDPTPERNATGVAVLSAGGHARAKTVKVWGTLKVFRPLKAIRQKCIDCSAFSPKSVQWCTMDGLHSSRCHLWPYRFGMRPETFSQKYGRELVTPQAMPGASVSEDELPNGIEAGTRYLMTRISNPT